MIKAKLKIHIEEALKRASNQSGFETLSRLNMPIVVEEPQLAEHGDYATSIALKASFKARLPAMRIAEALVAELEKLLPGIAEAESISPGYINFRVQKPLLQEILKEINSEGVNYGLIKGLDSYLSGNKPQNLGAEESEAASQIQYAHARCCAILRMALEPIIDIENKNERPALISLAQWQEWQKLYKNSPDIFAALFDSDPKIFMQQKQLIIRLSLLPEEAEKARSAKESAGLLQYAYNIAKDFQAFYQTVRIITPDPETIRARLGLVSAVRQVLSNTLSISGLNAPERM